VVPAPGEPCTVREPLRCLPALEAALEANDDGRAVAARILGRQVRRDAVPSSFPAWLALQAFGLALPPPEDLAAAVEWLGHLDALRERPWGLTGAARFVLADLAACRGELSGGPSMLGRLLARRLEPDERAATAARAEDDARRALGGLRRALGRAATERGLSAAERGLRAALEALREAWEGVHGPDLPALAERAHAAIDERRAAMSSPGNVANVRRSVRSGPA
jgi:hypothetical protein